MPLRLCPASEKARLWALLRYYLNEIGPYSPDGIIIDYPGFQDFWQQPTTHFPYFIETDGGEIVGFALVRRWSDEDVTELSDLFILSGSRLEGHGRSALKALAHAHPGAWQTWHFSSHSAAKLFLDATINDVAAAGTDESIAENSLTLRRFTVPA